MVDLHRGRDRLPFSSRLRLAFFLCSFLALTLLSLSSYPFLCSRFPLSPSSSSSSLLPFIPPSSSDFNRTLVAFAGIDLSDFEMSRQASIMLDAAWKPPLAERIWRALGLVRESTQHRLEAARLKFARAGQRLPMQLSSAKYAAYWPQFRSALQSWVERKRYEPRVMSSLIRLVKDPVDRYYLKKGKHGVHLGEPYKTCAVVGNSGILLNQSFAGFIDSHDMVIRLNNARTANFQLHVGSKTSLAFINSNILHACTGREHCYCHPYGPDVPIVLYICQIVHFMDVTLCGASDETPIIVTDPRFDILCSRIVKYYSIKNFVESTGRPPEDWSEAHDGPMFHYSSGMQAVMLALGICDKVRMFGFGKAPGAKHHYHTNQRGELDLHDYTAEYQFYHDLVQNRTSLVPFLSEAGFLVPPVELYEDIDRTQSVG